MKIGSIEIDTPLMLAPMAGVADLAFRILCRRFGAEYAVSEMISAKAMTYHDKKTFELIESTEEDSPLGIQLFGHEPDVMAKAADMLLNYHPVVIDINMGCPTPKIVNSGEGSALMKTPDLAYAIAKEVVRAAGTVPVSVKMRSGWDESSINAVEIAKFMEDAGVSFITVHGRTRAQFYSFTADWDIIAKVKKSVSIPVIGNGDITSGEDAVKMLSLTGCDGLMIGRSSLGSPWLFAEAAAALGKAQNSEPFTVKDKMAVALEQTRLAVKFKGERVAIPEMRKHLCWYFKGMRNGHAYKNIASHVSAIDDVEELCSRAVFEAENGALE